ncbi:MAG: hypothetical protein DCC43_01840 [Candidatus Brocadia sp.]|nr:hypothetical protein [Candidatus Brocadia sp. AMX3]RIK02852.1 MAG: hypothetical protein DCC43_01840 [Candidatus Brocadia sp.]
MIVSHIYLPKIDFDILRYHNIIVYFIILIYVNIFVNRNVYNIDNRKNCSGTGKDSSHPPAMGDSFGLDDFRLILVVKSF